MHEEITELTSIPIDWSKRSRLPTSKILDNIPTETFFQEFQRVDRILTHSIHCQLILHHRQRLLQLQKRNKNRNSFKAKIGEHVLYRHPTDALDKLKPRRLGPWRVLDYNSTRGLYKLCDTSDDKVYDEVHEAYVYPLLMFGKSLHPDEIVRLAALDRGEIFATDVVFHFFATNKKTKKEELHLRILYEDGTQRDHAISTIRDLACVQWYICTHPDLYDKYGSIIAKKKSERERRYTELRAMFTRPEEERQSLEEEQRSTTNIVENPITPQIPQVTLNKKINEDSKSNFRTLQHVYDKSPRRVKRGTKEHRRHKRLQKKKLQRELRQSDKWLRRIKRTRRVHQGLQEEKRREDRHVKGYKRKTRRNERKTRNEKKRNRKTRDKEESSTLHTTKIRLQ